MKRNAIICAAVLSLTAGGLVHAANPGAYAGLGLGMDRANIEDVLDHQDRVLIQKAHGSISDHFSSLAGRVFGGFNFNENFGLEVGYNAFGTSKETVKLPGYSNFNLEYKLSSYDLRGKAYLPLQDNRANVYAIAGIAYAKQDIHVNETLFTDSYSKNTNRYRPVYGLGANYDLNKQVTTAVEVTRQQGLGDLSKSPKAMPNVDTVMFTVAYNFS